MQIKDYQCKCGSKDFFALKKDEGHVGIYCQSCGKWLKWADKNAKQAIDGIISLSGSEAEDGNVN